MHDQIPVQPPSPAQNIVESDDTGLTCPLERARIFKSGFSAPVESPVKQNPRSCHYGDHGNPKWGQDGDDCLQQKEMHNFAKMSQSEFNKTKTNMSQEKRSVYDNSLFVCK